LSKKFVPPAAAHWGQFKAKIKLGVSPQMEYWNHSMRLMQADGRKKHHNSNKL
jgi:hypothetical protein